MRPAATGRLLADLRAVLPGRAGPSVYVMAPEPLAPEVDVRLYDASALCVLQTAEADADVAEAMGGVTAFSHERQRVHRAGELPACPCLPACCRSRLRVASRLAWRHAAAPDSLHIPK